MTNWARLIESFDSLKPDGGAFPCYSFSPLIGFDCGNSGPHKFIHSRKKLSVTVFPGWKDLVTVFLASIKTYSKRLGLTWNFDLELQVRPLFFTCPPPPLF